MKTVKAKIIGTVQGVFFRKFVKDCADELDIKGFARNLEDGNIEVVIEGEDGRVNEMVDRCKKGPGHADIKDVKIEEMNHQGFDSFKILSM